MDAAASLRACKRYLSPYIVVRGELLHQQLPIPLVVVHPAEGRPFVVDEQPLVVSARKQCH